MSAGLRWSDQARRPVALSAPPDGPLAACRGRRRASVSCCPGSRLGRPHLTVVMSRCTCSPAPPLLPYAARASAPFRRCDHRATPPTAALPAGVPALPLSLTVVLAGWPRRVLFRSASRSNSCGTAPVPVILEPPHGFRSPCFARCLCHLVPTRR